MSASLTSGTSSTEDLALSGTRGPSAVRAGGIAATLARERRMSRSAKAASQRLGLGPITSPLSGADTDDDESGEDGPELSLTRYPRSTQHGQYRTPEDDADEEDDENRRGAGNDDPAPLPPAAARVTRAHISEPRFYMPAPLHEHGPAPVGAITQLRQPRASNGSRGDQRRNIMNAAGPSPQLRNQIEVLCQRVSDREVRARVLARLHQLHGATYANANVNTNTDTVTTSNAASPPRGPHRQL